MTAAVTREAEPELAIAPGPDSITESSTAASTDSNTEPDSEPKHEPAFEPRQDPKPEVEVEEVSPNRRWHGIPSALRSTLGAELGRHRLRDQAEGPQRVTPSAQSAGQPSWRATSKGRTSGESAAARAACEVIRRM